ncbi:MAG: mechanosensitive ion channel family protein [Saprospiraceae bacterium]
MFQQFSNSLSNLYNKLSGWVNEVVLALPNIVLAAIVLSISIYLSRYLKKLVCKTLLRTTKNNTVVGVISNIAVAGFMIVSLFIVLNILNLSEAVTALLGTAGVIGLAVGLALQDPLINLFSGVLMSVKDYYQVGDLIETNGFFGKISKITLRSTIIAQLDGQEVIIPNKEVLQNPLKNFSHNGRRRIELDCGVAYGDDLEKVEEIAINAVKNSGLNFRESKPIEFFYTEFGDSSINFRIRFWKNIVSQADYFMARHTAIKALKKAFDQNNITIPFPITTLDFGVVGGVRVDDIYPPQKIKVNKARVNGVRAASE